MSHRTLHHPSHLAILLIQASRKPKNQLLIYRQPAWQTRKVHPLTKVPILRIQKPQILAKIQTILSKVQEQNRSKPLSRLFPVWAMTILIQPRMKRRKHISLFRWPG